MTTAQLVDSNKMYNRLFWIDWISRLWALGAAAWSIWLIVQTILNTLPGAHVSLTVAANQDYPPHPGELFYSGSAYVLQGTSVHFTQATMTVAHLPAVTVILLGLGQIFAAVTSAGIAWCIFLLAQRLRADQPFAASTAHALTAAGLILGIGCTASNLATAFGQIGKSYIAYMPKYGELTLGGSSTTFIDFVPLFFAAVLFALAGVFRYGEKLQRDNAALKRDTTGLV
jgi:hypothetical protein